MASVRSGNSRVIESDEYSEDSSSSYLDINPKRKVKNCCRKVVAFMCTQVGVGGLIVSYAVAGAVSFQIIERNYTDPKIHEISRYRNLTSNDLWKVTNALNTLNKTHWDRQTQEILLKFQNEIAKAVQHGYNSRSADMWTFPAALMFCLSVFTMIGYGNIVPRTVGGKVATMVYAIFGIPLYVLYFRNMGQFLAHTFRWTYTWVYRCSMEDRYPKSYERNVYDQQTRKRVIVPSTACLWVLFAYVATGTIMFSRWQSWSFMDSAYFCVTSLCKIGIGDFSPDNIFISETEGGQTFRLIITFVYLLFGMGLIAMCFDLMKEDVTVKVKNLKSDIGICFEDIRIRAVEFYRRRNSLD